MELKHRGRRFLPRIIQQLKKAGDIEEIHGGPLPPYWLKTIARAAAKERPSPVQQEERAASGSPKAIAPTRI